MTDMNIAPMQNAGVVTPDNVFQPLALRAMFWRPAYLESSAWLEHIPFAFWLMEAHRPKVFVELGIGLGTSYFAFCQGVDRIGLDTQCFAVDAWNGDEAENGAAAFAKVNAYNEEHYAGFSRLLRSSFDDALAQFSDHSIDLLHIDGRQGFDAVRHDVERWLPKLSPRAVLVLANANVRERNAGVFKMVEELRMRYPAFEFLHGPGVAVLGVGAEQSVLLQRLYQCDEGEVSRKAVQEVFSRLGRACADAFAARQQLERANTLHAEVAQQKKQIDEFKASLDKTKADLTTRSKDLTETRTRLQNQIEQHAVERGQLAERVALYQELRAELKSEVARLQVQSAEMLSELKVRADDVSRLEASNTTHQRQAEELRKNLQERDAKVSTIIQQREKLQAELRLVEGKLQAHEQQMQVLLGDIREDEKKQAALEEALREREKETDLWKQQCEAAQARIAASEVTWSKLEHTLKTQVQGLNADVQGRDRDIRSLRDSNQSQEAETTALRVQQAALEAQLDALRNAAGEYQRQIEQSNAAVAELTRSLEAARVAHDDQEQQVAALRDQLATLSAGMIERDQARDTLSHELDTANRHCAGQREQIAALQEQLGALTAELAARDAAQTALSRDLDAADRERTAQSRQIEELERQAGHARQALRAAEVQAKQTDENQRAESKAHEAAVERLTRANQVLEAEKAKLSDKLEARFNELARLTQMLDEAGTAEAAHTAAQEREQSAARHAELLSRLAAAEQAHAAVSLALEQEQGARKAGQAELAELSLRLDTERHERDMLLHVLRTHVARLGTSITSGQRAGGLLDTLMGKTSRNKAERKLANDMALLQQSGLMDEAWYMERYPDVRAGSMNPVFHYLKYGAAENRDPGPMFSTGAYIGAYPDVAGSGINPLLHFINHGSREGRVIFSVKES